MTLKRKQFFMKVNIEPRQGQAEADHARTGERGHLSSHDRSFHWHHQPHGIYLEIWQGTPILHKPLFC